MTFEVLMNKIVTGYKKSEEEHQRFIESCVFVKNNTTETLNLKNEVIEGCIASIDTTLKQLILELVKQHPKNDIDPSLERINKNIDIYAKRLTDKFNFLTEIVNKLNEKNLDVCFLIKLSIKINQDKDYDVFANIQTSSSNPIILKIKFENFLSE